MQRRAPRFYLQDIQGSIAQVFEYASAGEAEFKASPLLQDAIVRQLQIVGEAVHQLPGDLLEKEPGIPWERVVGMRNRLVHAYHEINLDVVWDTVQRELPVLRAAAERMLQNLDPGE